MKAYINRTIRQTGAVALSALMALSLPAAVHAQETDVFADADQVYETTLIEDTTDEAVYTTAESVVVTLNYDETAGTTWTISDIDSGISVSEKKGATLISITAAGSYTLTGTAKNAYISIAKDINDSVILILDSLTIDDSELNAVTESDNSVIAVKKGGPALNLILTGDNYITGSGTYTDEPEAIIKAPQGSITISGTGTLDITDDMNVSGVDPSDAISSKYGSVTVKSGTINIHDIEGSGIKAKGGIISIEGGTVSITNTGSEGLKAKYDEESTIASADDNGEVSISGGAVIISDCESDGIQAEFVDISGGTVDITTVYDSADVGFYTSGSSSSTLNTISGNDSTKTERVVVDTGSHKAIKTGTKAKTEAFTDTTITTSASGGLTISGGTINVDTTGTGIKVNGLRNTSGYTATSTGVYIIGGADDAIHSNNTIDITGGEITVSSADDGITAAGALNITGTPTINILTAYEGIEGQTLTIGTQGQPDGPTINIDSNDDGINTAGKTVKYTYLCASDAYDDDTYLDNYDYYAKTSTSSSSSNNCVIYSGSVNIKVDSNDVDNNNSVSLNGRTINYTVNGDGIDCNGTLDIEGGRVSVFGQSSGDNSPIDTNNGFTLGKDATVLATGTDGMGESTPESGDGVYIAYGSTGMGGGMAPGGNMGPGGNGVVFMAGAEEESSYITAEATETTETVLTATDESSETENDTFDRPGSDMGPVGNSRNMTPGGNSGNMGFGGNGGGMMGGDQAATITAGSTFTVASGNETLLSTTLPYAASFLLYASPNLTSGSSYTATIGTTSSTLTAATPGTAINNGGFPGGDNNNNSGFPGGGDNNNNNSGFPGGDNNNNNGFPGSNQDNSNGVPDGFNPQDDNAGIPADNNTETAPADPSPAETIAETTPTETATEAETATKETESTFVINGEEVRATASISYTKNITYTGKKIKVTELAATPDISSLTGAVQTAITNDNYSADDLFKVKYVIKNNKTAGGNSYFYAKIAFNNSAAKKAGLTAAERKSVKTAVSAMNKELKTTKRCYFTIDPVDLSSCSAEVTVKKLNSDGSVKVSDSGALKSIKSVTVTTADGTTFKLGSKRCSVLVLDSSTGEVQITGKGDNFTGTVTAFAVK